MPPAAALSLLAALLVSFGGAEDVLVAVAVVLVPVGTVRVDCEFVMDSVDWEKDSVRVLAEPEPAAEPPELVNFE